MSVARVKGTGPHEVFEGLATPHFYPADLKLKRGSDRREAYCDAVNISTNCRGIRCVYCLFNPCATDPKVDKSFKKWELILKVGLKRREIAHRESPRGEGTQ